MSEENRCPECGTPLPARGPLGLCPGCLLKRGIETAPPASVAGQAGGDFTPPTPEQLASQFPDLEILEFVGRGGMGMVYKARQKQLDRLVALKILLPNIARDPAFAERFTREARAMAMLSHPHIVTVYDFGTKGELYYFVMEFVDGLTLRQLLDAGKLAPPAALAIVPQICEALQFAHDKGVVHRDIKPENILMDRGGQVKIADFGLAKLVGEEAKDFSLTAAGQVMGTPHYMAPEQIEHPQEVDHRADIYSLGVVFYQMLTGELPIGRFAPPSQRVQVDVRLDEVVLRALEKEPGLRYQQASDIKTSVETIATTPASGASDRIHDQKPSTASGNSQRFLCGIPIVERRGGKSVIFWPGVRIVWLAVFGCMTFVAVVLWLITDHAIPLGGSLVADLLFTTVFVWSGVRTARRQLDTADTTPGVAPLEPAVKQPAWQSPTMGWGHFVGYIFGTTFKSPWAYRFANLSALGFLAFGAFFSELPIPGAHEFLRFAGFSGFFGLIGVAFTIEFAARRKARAAASRPPASASPPPHAKYRKLWKLFWAVALIALVAGFVRTFVAQPFVVAASGVEPELPRGSRILVWKLSGTFAPGDLVAYYHDNLVFVGRVGSDSVDQIIINRNQQPDDIVARRRVIGKVFSVYWRPSIAEPSYDVAAVTTPPPATPDNDRLSSLDESLNACSLPPVNVNQKAFGAVEVLLVTRDCFGNFPLARADYGLPPDSSVEQVAAKADRGDLYLTLSAKDGPAADRARLMPLRDATFFPLELPRIEPESPNWSYIDRLRRMTRGQIAAAGDAFLAAHCNGEDRAASVSEGQKYAFVRPDGETFVLSIGELTQNADGGNRQLQLSMARIGKIPWGTSFSVGDTQGKPVAGATAIFSTSKQVKKVDGVATYGTHPMGTFQADAQGCIRLPPQPRGANFCGPVAAAGYITRDDLSGFRDKDGHYYPPGVDGSVQLKRPGAIEGRCLGPDGKPLVHVPLSLTTNVTYPHAKIFTANHLRTITDEQGRFRMEGVPPGQHVLYYPWEGPTQAEVDSGRWRALGTMKDGHLTFPLPLAGYGLVRPVTVEESATVHDVMLDFSQSTAAIKGQVLDAAGKPVSGAAVKLFWSRGDGTNWMSLTLPDILSDAQGQYRIDHLPPGSFQLQAVPPGMKVAPENTPAPVQVEVTAHKVLEQDLRLGPGGQ